MERLKLIKTSEKRRIFSRRTAKDALENVISRIKEANNNEEFYDIIEKIDRVCN